MDKYGLLERSQGSSGCRKRFLSTYHPSLKRPANMCCGESQGVPAPWVCRGPWMGSPDPRQLQGEGQFTDDSVGKVAPSCGDGAGGTERRLGLCCSASQAVEEEGQWPSSRYCSPRVRHSGTSCEQLQEGLVTLASEAAGKPRRAIQGEPHGTNAVLILCLKV